MEKPFAALFRRELDEFVVAENANFIALVESKPLNPGHVVVVAKAEVDSIWDLSETALSDLMNFARPIAQKLEKLVVCKKVGVAVIGLETRHAHLHLVPMMSADDLNFTRAKLSPPIAEIVALAKKLRE